MHRYTVSLEQLRAFIGRRVRHHDIECQIIEILEDGPALVLQDCEQHTVIQADQHGEAHRRVAPTFIVPVAGDEAGELNPAFVNLNLLT
ncbi:MAG: hypothetical protein O2845_01415 [Proteobacteria bacterium]|nr:hypothetical protein [Pseudomonadota bacterium]